MTAKPNQNINPTERNRRLSDDDKQAEDKESASIWEDTLGWILERSKSNAFLTEQLNTMLDRHLPERLVNLVDGDDNEETPTNGNSDCIKQLLCKTTPFVWSMQKAVSAHMSTTDTQMNAEKHPSRSDTGDNSKNDGNYMNAFFKYLPSLDEFKNHGITCEDQYKECKLF